MSNETSIKRIIRILYAAGNPQAADLVRYHFAELAPQFSVDAVYSCADALVCLRKFTAYDLVLIDLSLTCQSGLNFLRVASDSSLLLPPVIVLAETSGEEAAIAALKQGAADYIIRHEGYLNQLIYRIDFAIAYYQLNRLNQKLQAEVAERKQIEENLSLHQTELEMQNKELLQTQLELGAVRARFYDLYNLAPVGYFTVSKKGEIRHVNNAAASLVGVAQNKLVKQHFYQYILKEDQDSYYRLCQQVLNNSESQKCELQMVKSDGALFWAQLTATVQDVGGGQVFHIVINDISERKQAEEKLRLAASVFTDAYEGIMITAKDGTIIDVNDAFCRISGYDRAEVLGKNPRLLSSGYQEKEFYVAMWRDLLEHGHWNGELWNLRKNGEHYAIMQTISAVYDDQGNIRHFVSLFSDITSIKEHERELDYCAHYDVLTGLPNRLLLADRLQQGIAQSRRRGQLLAVAFLDLDGFKAVNDDHRHEAGDQLLIALAARMKQTLREGDTLARMGGDEFVAILLDLADIEASVPMLNRLLTAAAEPVQYGKVTLQVSASLGVTFYPQTELIDAHELLRQADQAMYQAKQAGKNRYHFFDHEHDSEVIGRYESLEHIRKALTAHEFVLYYQPKVNMRTGTVIGAEALIRWQHPEKGLLPPLAFLPVIEDHQLAVNIGEWVIDTALMQIELWQAAGLNIPVSVNIGARQLQQTDFVERLCNLLAAHPTVSPSCLILEVMESSGLKNMAKISQVIEVCRRIGVMFAMDDFGAGYSSLTYLKQMPVSTIKIDKTFVQGMTENLDDLYILKSLLSLSADLQREVIAEGVETLEDGTILLQLGCELAQGYGIAHPMPAHELPAWSAAWRPDPSWSGTKSLH